VRNQNVGSETVVAGANRGWASPQRLFSDGSSCRRSLSERLSDPPLHHHIQERRTRLHREWQERELDRLVEEVTTFLYLTTVNSQPIIHKKVPSPLTPEILNGLGR
jgi:hypothetical protein